MVPPVPRVIRRPQSTLVVYANPAGGSPAVYKLSQRDVLRVEQATQSALDFIAQPALRAAVDSLGAPLLALDAADQAVLAPLGYIPPAASSPMPASQTPRPAGAPPAGPAQPEATADESPASGLRLGLVAAVIVLAAVVLVILLLLGRLFSSPGSSARITTTPSVTVALTTTLTLTPGAPSAVALIEST